MDDYQLAGSVVSTELPYSTLEWIYSQLGQQNHIYLYDKSDRDSAHCHDAVR